MRYMIVNIDKQQYFRPIELGAPHGSKYLTVADAQGARDWRWLLLLIHLLESSSSTYYGAIAPWFGAWSGDRVAIVRNDDETGTFLDEELQALKALGADVKDYAHLRENYEDLTPELKKAWSENFRAASSTSTG